MAMTRLSLACLNSGMADYEIAAQVHISKSMMSRYTLGRVPVPTRLLIDFSSILGVPAADLDGWTEELSVSNARDVDLAPRTRRINGSCI